MELIDAADAVGGRTRSRRSSGFSLIEALIASYLLLMIVLGVLPLFTRAAIQNVAGRESTGVSNVARSRTEELYQLPFNSPQLTIASGEKREEIEYFDPETGAWDTVAPTLHAEWIRTTIIRQYSVRALDDDVLEVSEALVAGTDPGQVHFKEIQVTVEGGRASGPLGAPKQVTVRVLKSQ